MIKLCVFDFDSTLMDGETIDFLAKAHGIGDEVSLITKEAMEGKIDFFEALTKRVKLLEGMNILKADSICHNLPYMDKAEETIASLKQKGCKVVVFSGGFRSATSYAKEILQFDCDFANILHIKNDKLTGQVGGDMMFSNSKGDMLKRLQILLQISPEETMSVGDGANDLSMFAFSKLKIAFCAKPILKAKANAIIDKKDISEILNYI